MSNVTVTDPATLLNNHLASALGTMGDAQFWEENISPSTIRQSLASSDPSNPNSTPELLKGMKWLLASISKGRDVSDFYSHVVKLVGATSLEVRKMVYMYLVQYADHDSTTRELSLLSINSFQRGLADSEQLIRALALRVLTSIRIPDILQIQILGIQKCSKDFSPYVRKCAANALAKLNPRCDNETATEDDNQQREMLLEIMKSLLDNDTSTMVLSSALISFAEICPERLELIHTSFRKICHLLTDMDEWGQVVVLDILSRYCRTYFKQPHAWKHGSAEIIDKQRRVRRVTTGIQQHQPQQLDVGDALDAITGTASNAADKTTNKAAAPVKKVKRRVVKKGFYSDEEDESTEEEVYANTPIGSAPISLANSMRQRNIIGIGPGGALGGGTGLNNNSNTKDTEDEDLHEDHKLLLRSSMPLLKSRNSGVVLAVCSVQYYCGVSSIQVRSSIGKALVRIYRDRREIQYIVLKSIRTLVHECPSAFTPFLQDFFVKAMDPPFTRITKLEILTSLALEPNAIDVVLKELRTYVLHGDKKFVCESIRTVGKISELAKIVYSRRQEQEKQQHGSNNNKNNNDANRVALNCLHGLITLSQSSDNAIVVGECTIVMQQILLQLMSSSSPSENNTGNEVLYDPNHVQETAIRRILLLLVRSMSSKIKKAEGEKAQEDEDDEDDEEEEQSDIDRVTIDNMPPSSVATALWIIGEWIAPVKSNSSKLSASDIVLTNIDEQMKSKIRLEVLRLIVKSFLYLDPIEKLQAIHLASKVLISNAAITSSSSTLSLSTNSENPLCELILSMGRVDVNADVRDRSRYESSQIHVSIGLQHDTDAMEELPTMKTPKMSLDELKNIFLKFKPAGSYLPLDDVYNNELSLSVVESGGTTTSPFRFGTLSSIVGHRARTTYLPLPPWATKNSPGALRDPPAASASQELQPQQQRGPIENMPTGAFRDDGGNKGKMPTAAPAPAAGGTFYESSSDSSSSSSGSSSDDGSASDDEKSTSSSSSSDGSSSSSSDENETNPMPTQVPMQPSTGVRTGQAMATMNIMNTTGSTYSDDPFAAVTNTNQNPVTNQIAGFAETVDSSSDDSSDSDSESAQDNNVSSSDSDDDNGPSPHSVQISGGGNGTGIDSLIPMGGGGGILQHQASTTSAASANGSSSMVDDFKGMVLAPVVMDADEESIGEVLDSSMWFELVRPQYSGGLSVKIRYLRGATKEREVQLLGLQTTGASTVCVEMQLENKRTDGAALRRLKVLKHSSSSSNSSSTIVPRKIALPMEVGVLATGQKCNLKMAIDFMSPSDRDGSCVARLDMKFSGGSIPIEIKPSLGEFLQPCRRYKVADFDRQLETMQGFQRVTSTFDVTDTLSKNNNSESDKQAVLLRSILKRAAFTVVKSKKSEQENDSSSSLRFVGSLPAGSDPVFVLIQYSEDNKGNITVCCENALALNAMMSIVKRALTE